MVTVHSVPMLHRAMAPLVAFAVSDPHESPRDLRAVCAHEVDVHGARAARHATLLLLARAAVLELEVVDARALLVEELLVLVDLPRALACGAVLSGVQQQR